MTKQDAYRIVYNDILNHGCELFQGTFDARNGSKDFMHGICTLMECIAYQVSEQDYKDFNKIWCENFQKSLDKAR